MEPRFRIARTFFLPLAGLVCLTAACHSGKQPPHTAAWDDLEPAAQRYRMVQDAQKVLHRGPIEVGGKKFPYDCSGVVGGVLYKNGFDVSANTQALSLRGNGVNLLREFVLRYGDLTKNPKPLPGELVFFSNTYDRNRDRRINDAFTHVGIVERVDFDGTITFIHHLQKGMRRSVMNLRQPNRHRNRQGKTINDFLRRKHRSDPRGTRYLAGSLFSGFGSLIQDGVTETIPIAQR